MNLVSVQLQKYNTTMPRQTQKKTPKSQPKKKNTTKPSSVRKPAAKAVKKRVLKTVTPPDQGHCILSNSTA